MRNAEEFLQAALGYAERGWPVFPLRGKVPIAGSHGFKDGSIDPEKIKNWWHNGSPYNVGFATGKDAGIFVLDVDPAKGGDDTLREHERTYGPLPETPQVITGSGGVHYYFRMPPQNLTISEGKIGVGLDTRGNGGYVVLPPSIHPDTRRVYTWEALHDIDEIDVADVPAWLIGLLQSSEKLPPVTETTVFQAGERNGTLFRHGCRLRQHGYSADEILAFLSQMNSDRCHPPLTEKELRQIATQAAKYRAGESLQPPGPDISTPQKPRTTRMSALTLLGKTFAPLRWFAAGLLHEGNVIFAGKSKRGKSWIALNLAVSLATGTDAFGHYEIGEPIKVAYCALEDGERRVSRRLVHMEAEKLDLANLELIFDMPKFKEGGIDVLRGLVEEGFKAIIIDVLAKVEGGGKNGSKDYLEAYEDFRPLQELRNAHSFALVLITHLRKAEAEEMSEAVMGSVAYVGAQDVVWIFNRRYGEDSGYLEIIDKDMPEKTVEIVFQSDMGRWTFVGEGDEHAANKEQRDIIQFICEEGKPQSAAQIMQGIGVSQAKYQAFRKRMQRMVAEGQLFRTERGLYAAIGRSAWEKLDNDSPL